MGDMQHDLIGSEFVSTTTCKVATILLFQMLQRNQHVSQQKVGITSGA
jgi:H2-forming N5,N10-methylenetetrahydromethanopterin dehydrogenase-like enzyme